MPRSGHVHLGKGTFHEENFVCGSFTLTVRIETRSNLLFEVILPGTVPQHLTVDCIQEANRKLSAYGVYSPIDLRAAEFNAALSCIPAGTTLTYGELAKRLGSSPRGIASRCSANRLLIRVPCHRIVSGDGIGGYRAGIGWKKALLQLELNSCSSHASPSHDCLLQGWMEEE